ncbi:MAG: biopolymer transporter ExbD [Candidatus Krumholzibacteriota bacterium]|nr:biopolymer transporter ExbD [Candidatus Krumholzibacteriota bacterium]
MRFDLKQKRRAAINITSLIDVLFLLLIFFMVSSTFLEQPGMKLDLPAAEAAEAARAGKLTVFIGPGGEILFGDRAVPVDSLEAAMREAVASADDRTLVLKADRDARHGTVVQVMDIAKRAGLERLVVATQAGER